MHRPLEPFDAVLLTGLALLDTGDGVPLVRLAKQLDQRVSVLLRSFTLLGDATLGGVPGPGFVRTAETEGRWRAWVTPAGRAAVVAAQAAVAAEAAAGNLPLPPGAHVDATTDG